MIIPNFAISIVKLSKRKLVNGLIAKETFTDNTVRRRKR